MMLLTAKILQVLAILWHTIAFAAGGVNAFRAYRTLFGGTYDPATARVIHSAEWQLWTSGLVIIGFGIGLSGWSSYLNNPKLWTKIVVVTVWLLSTLVLRYVAPHHWRAGNRKITLWGCAVSGACWIYGAFLGVAKPLANGVVPFWGFMAGYLLAVAGCLAFTLHLDDRR